MRIIINTGKGGVGKTTISALTAINISKRYKTLVISSDLAHSLSDLLDIKLDDTPRKVAHNLYALEINAIKESKKAWGNLNLYIRQLVEENALDDIQLDELLLLPGLDDVFSLLKILEIYKSGEFEVLVVDCGPSGETISLLSTGEKFKNLADSLVPLVKRFNRLFGSFIEKQTEVKKPKDIVFDEFISLSKKLYELEKILQDPAQTTIRFVTKANKVVANETFRSFSLTNMYDFLTDCIFVNMIYPEAMRNSSYDNLLDEEARIIRSIDDFFKEEKVIKLSLKDYEVIGLEALNRLHDEYFVDQYLEDIFIDKKSFELIEEKASKVILINLDYAKGDEVKVEKIGEDLEISYLNFKRRFKLPDTVSSRKISSFSLEDKKLRIVLDYD
ncbi:arsenite-activated ATPase (arsA) [Anaerococcus lactolyticus ATCC 51172]|uniref:Arsenite-activated ATPase (ArsA) n=1 Tax=Anaerococcus lactolyticus ATCC 51172 TaxID=525254 RepID=C2BHG0_9FIRM|nr:ArsA family ATPase [Anaerococcus lactolyticus]EEI85573.1 arsenite-activated ATPase (arsA) [Anaerococcus lactolyticus ATCC 51172]